MLRVRLKPNPLMLFCSIRVPVNFFVDLNCATTGKDGDHPTIDPATEQSYRSRFEQALTNAKPEDFNFRHLTNPDDWNKFPKGDIRTANGAFFTLLYQYNKEAEKEGKPIIDGDDLIAFLKRCVRDKLKTTKINQMTARAETPTGNDNVYVMEVKAPLKSLLQGKDTGILATNSLLREMKLGPETDIYVKVAFDPTYRRDKDGNLTILEEGIQPLSIHRDADSKITKPDPNDPDVKDEAWDTDKYDVDPKLMSKSADMWFRKYGSKYSPNKPKK